VDLRISRLHYPVTVLGPGRRVGVWVQGCSIGCVGCMSRDTWDPAGGEPVDTTALNDLILSARDDAELDGVTISGGEPFQQPEALAELLRKLRREWPPADVLVYSGYSLDRLRQRHGDLLADIDAVMTGPFLEAQRTNERWRGSSNQVLTVLNPLLDERYFAETLAPTLQVSVDETAVWITGIPRRGDLERIRAKLAGSGLLLEDVSWLS
jgi:anaerobic ribonucleoside-triphosphate reductase activating protein